ncbi:MAG: hypothetical protein Q9170_002068 [Blastenia crenularia]
MSQKARVSALATDLLANFQLCDKAGQPEYGSSLKEWTLQTLLDPKPARINQFEVAARLEGLEDKFRVFTNDELADALHDRLDELQPRSNRWTPEILSLLLELSDQPLQKTKIEDLELLKPVPESPPLTWSDIVREDPLDNRDGLWDNVEFAQDDSDEDADGLVRISSPSDTSSNSSHDSDGVIEVIRSWSVVPDRDGLDDIIKGQFWNRTVQGAREPPVEDNVDHGTFIELTETQAIREIGFMLSGLPTSIYEQQFDGKLVLSTRYRFRHVSRTAASQMLNDFAAMGSSLSQLRAWKSGKQHQSLLQTFQAVLSKKIYTVEDDIARAQRRCIDSRGDNTASLLAFYNQVMDEVRFIRQLAVVVGQLEQAESPQRPYQVLELLYDRVCLSHDIGDIPSFEYMAEVFFTCLQTYLKPLKHWMECGELNRHGSNIFIQENRTDTSLESYWTDRYQLLLDSTGQLHAPKFLHLAAKKILNAGKSVHFLRLLDHISPDDHSEKASTVQVDLDSVSADFGAHSLYSFLESFNRLLDEWIGGSYRLSSALLRQVLDSQCGLQRALDALEYIYLFRNTATSNVIASEIFIRIDYNKEDWNDEFALTDILRDGFAAISCVDTENLDVQASTSSAADTDSKPPLTDILSSFRIIYALPWPVANVITKSTMRIYPRVFTLLLQLRRAQELLERRYPRIMVTRLIKSREGSRVIMLRHRMLWFVNTIFSYMTGVALSAATLEMRRRIAESDDLDEMIAAHQAYIARLNEQCLLSKDWESILQAITSMLDLVVLFTDAYATGKGLAPSLSSNAPERPVSMYRDHSDKGSQGAESDSSELDEEEAKAELDERHVTLATVVEGPSFARLKNMHDTFIQLQGFVLVGLRGAGKGGEDSGVEMLANMLAVGHRTVGPKSG